MSGTNKPQIYDKNKRKSVNKMNEEKEIDSSDLDALGPLADQMDSMNLGREAASSTDLGAVVPSLADKLDSLTLESEAVSETLEEKTKEKKKPNDEQKFNTAKELHTYIDKIRDEYCKGWNNKEEKIRQRVVALYLIDLLSLRAGYKKHEGVGCCTLLFEHITLHESTCMVELNFSGKFNTKFHRKGPVEEPVFKNLKDFINKTIKIFDKLTADKLNEYLQKQPKTEIFDEQTAIKLNEYLEEQSKMKILDKLTADKLNEYLQKQSEMKIFNELTANKLKKYLHEQSKMKIFDELTADILNEYLHKQSEIKIFNEQTADKLNEYLRKQSETKIFDKLSADKLNEYLRQQSKTKIFDKLTANKLNEYLQKQSKMKIFDEITAETLYAYLKKISGMPDLTLKFFRTYNASKQFEKHLNNNKPKDHDAKKHFETSVHNVAVLLNHRKAVTSIKSYIDPRIVVAWCESNDIEIEEIFTDAQLKDFKKAFSEPDQKEKFKFAMSSQASDVDNSNFRKLNWKILKGDEHYDASGTNDIVYSIDYDFSKQLSSQLNTQEADCPKNNDYLI